MYRAIYIITTECYIIFNYTRNTKIDHFLDHHTSLNNVKIIKIIQSLFVDHNGIILEISGRRMSQECSKQDKDITKKLPTNFIDDH